MKNISSSYLLKYFERVAEAPNAIPRLRKFILDLAVRGKLVEQDPNDEPASKLLKRAETTEVSFKIPESWLSVKAGELLNIQYGCAA
jgi:type I restriction enzyme S subunit